MHAGDDGGRPARRRARPGRACRARRPRRGTAPPAAAAPMREASVAAKTSQAPYSTTRAMSSCTVDGAKQRGECRSSRARLQPHCQRQVQITSSELSIARLRAQREAPRDAVDQLPAAGGRVEAALVADVPAPRELLAEADDRSRAPRRRVWPHRQVVEAEALGQRARSRRCLRRPAAPSAACCSSAVSSPPRPSLARPSTSQLSLSISAISGSENRRTRGMQRRAARPPRRRGCRGSAASPRCRAAGCRPRR